MEIDWTVLAFIVVGFFALNGFFRGWWKEAIITFFLTILIGLLQYPEVAQGLIDFINGLIAAVWEFIPASITQIFSDTEVINFNNPAPQIEAGATSTWLIILILGVGLAILIGRSSLDRPPSLFGKLIGFLIGGVNGFLILNLVREYLDGRALPGNTPEVGGITLVGGSAFGPAASTVSIQASNLPRFTILDSIIPWVAMGIGLLFLFSILNTRVGIKTDPKDGKKIDKKTPPFYVPAKKPAPPPPTPTPVRIVEE